MGVLGGVLGVADDVPVLRRALEGRPWDAVLLGIPFEDLDAIRATVGQEQNRSFERDETDDLYLKQVERFAPPVIPPPDLYAAYAFAQERKIPVEAIDLGDEAHSESWSRNVGMFELLRNNRRMKNLPKHEFQSPSLEAFVVEWDEVVNHSNGLRRVQGERESWMAGRIQHFAQTHRALFALVPYARLVGLANRLERDFGFRKQ